MSINDYNDRYYLNINVEEYFKPKSIYNNKDIETGFNYLANQNKLNTYKFTFTKQKDDNYYFKSGEVVK